MLTHREHSISQTLGYCIAVFNDYLREPPHAPKQGRVHVLFDYCNLGLHDISKAQHEAQETCPTLLRALKLCDLQGQGFRKERER